MNNLIKFLKYWLPVIIWAGLIFYVSSIPNLKTELECDFLLRKIAHITEYFIFTLLLYQAFRKSFKLKLTFLYTYPAVLSFLYAVSDELHQAFVATRHASIYDVLIDGIGIISFYIVIKVISLKTKRN